MNRNTALLLIIILSGILSCNIPSNNSSNKTAFQWKQAGIIPSMENGNASLGLAGAVVGISHRKLLIGGGSNFPKGAPWEGGKKVYYGELYLYEKQKDSFICIQQGLHLPYPVAYGANCSSEKGIIIAGGENSNGAIKKVLFLSWNGRTKNIQFKFLPDLPLPLTHGMIAVNKEILYFAGGENQLGVSNQLYALNLGDNSKGWQRLPPLEHPVSHGLLLAAKDFIYLVGGRKRNIDSVSTLYKELYRYDIKHKQWTQKASLPYALSAQSGITWNDSTLLVFSGDQGQTFRAVEALSAEILKEWKTDKRKALTVEKNKLLQAHPGFGNVVLAYHINSDAWSKIDSIPFPGQVTTTALKWDKTIIIPCGEIRAGVRTPKIILGKR